MLTHSSLSETIVVFTFSLKVADPFCIHTGGCTFSTSLHSKIDLLRIMMKISVSTIKMLVILIENHTSILSQSKNGNFNKQV